MRRGRGGRNCVVRRCTPFGPFGKKEAYSKNSLQVLSPTLNLHQVLNLSLEAHRL